MAYISDSKMLLEGSFPKRKFLFRKYLMDYQKRKLYARRFVKIPEKCEKIPKINKKFPQLLERAGNGK